MDIDVEHEGQRTKVAPPPQDGGEKGDVEMDGGSEEGGASSEGGGDQGQSKVGFPLGTA